MDEKDEELIKDLDRVLIEDDAPPPHLDDLVKKLTQHDVTVKGWFDERR